MGGHTVGTIYLDLAWRGDLFLRCMGAHLALGLLAAPCQKDPHTPALSSGGHWLHGEQHLSGASRGNNPRLLAAPTRRGEHQHVAGDHHRRARVRWLGDVDVCLHRAALHAYARLAAGNGHRCLASLLRRAGGVYDAGDKG